MFLHSGASLHGHEYSNKPVNQPFPPGRRRSPLLISPFTSTAGSSAPANSSPLDLSAAASPQGTITRSSTIAVGATGRNLHPRSLLRRNSDSATGSVPPTEHVVRFLDPVVVDSPSVPRSATTPALASSGTLLRSKESMSEDDSAYEASEASYADDHVTRPRVPSKSTRRRHAPRKSTTFLLCQPAPKLSIKKPLLKRIRPTLLMQLQLVSPNARPMPVVDVYPSSLLVGNVAAPRFSKRFPRLFGINGELGLHDTILVRSEDHYHRPNSSDSEGEEDNFEHQALLAVFSPLRGESRSEIVLESGAVWVTSPLPNGSFDFVHVAENGVTTTARWVNRPYTKAPSSSDGTIAAGEPDRNFTFSIIDPHSRRHPIMATLSRTTLEILDHYTTVSPLTNSRYPPSRSRTQSPVPAETDESNDEEHPQAESLAPIRKGSSRGRTMLPVDPALKEIISISAIWVALHSGWGRSQATTSNTGSIQRSSSTIGPLSEHRNHEASKSNETMDSRGRGLLPKSKNQSPTSTQNRDQSPSLSPRGVLRNPILPRKATSTGAAYVRRLQMADSSDSDRPSFPRRSLTFSRLSVDGSTDATTPSEARWTGISPTSSLRRRSAVPPARSDLRSVIAPTLPSGGRSVSAYYATNPLSRSRLDEYSDAPVVHSPLDAAHGDASLPVNVTLPTTASSPISTTPRLSASIDVLDGSRRSGSVAERGSTSKWKKLGSWFKRLGGH